MGILGAAARFVVGAIFGDTYPAAPDRALPDFDARTHALRRFADFLALVEFSRTADAGAPATRYRIPRDNIHLEQPDDPVKLRFPAVAFLPARGLHDQWKLGPADLIPESRDVYGRGSALLDLGEYVEPFMVEAWGNHPAERRSILAGVETALRLGERSSALRLSLPAYYDRVASFALNESQYIDDPDVVRGRRRGQVMLELRVQEVLLVDVVSFKPWVDIDMAPANDPRTDV